MIHDDTERDRCRVAQRSCVNGPRGSSSGFGWFTPHPPFVVGSCDCCGTVPSTWREKKRVIPQLTLLAKGVTRTPNPKPVRARASYARMLRVTGPPTRRLISLRSAVAVTRRRAPRVAVCPGARRGPSLSWLGLLFSWRAVLIFLKRRDLAAGRFLPASRYLFLGEPCLSFGGDTDSGRA